MYSWRIIKSLSINQNGQNKKNWTLRTALYNKEEHDLTTFSRNYECLANLSLEHQD